MIVEIITNTTALLKLQELDVNLLEGDINDIEENKAGLFLLTEKDDSEYTGEILIEIKPSNIKADSFYIYNIYGIQNVHKPFYLEKFTKLFNQPNLELEIKEQIKNRKLEFSFLEMSLEYLIDEDKNIKPSYKLVQSKIQNDTIIVEIIVLNKNTYWTYKNIRLEVNIINSLIEEKIYTKEVEVESNLFPEEFEYINHIIPLTEKIFNNGNYYVLVELKEVIFYSPEERISKTKNLFKEIKKYYIEN